MYLDFVTLKNLSTTLISSPRHWLSLCRHCHIFATGFSVFDVQKSACWGTLCPILPKLFSKKIIAAGEVVADHCMECVDVQRIFEQKILLFHLRLGKKHFHKFGRDHFLRVEPLSVEFWCVHLVQLLKVCDHKDFVPKFSLPVPDVFEEYSA